MSLRIFTGFAALSCILLASCRPFNEGPTKKPTPKKETTAVVSPEQQKLQKELDELKAKEEAKRKELEAATKPQPPVPPLPTPEPPKPPEIKRTDYAVANKVPGKDGFVFSPYNNKVIDVKGMPSGTLVSDPTYPESAKKFFRVP